MKQHPIPQNVLDVEFKLFTKFTLKEFAYLAAGILGGSLFLLLNRQVGLPGIIAWPAFLLLSGLGAFLALVPINDQNADEFIKNFFTAINRPTQRVWLSDEMQENRTKPVINADLDQKKKIIGGDMKSKKKSSQFVEKPGDDILNTETNQATGSEDIEKAAQTKEDKQTTQQKNLTIGPQNISQYQFKIQSVDKFPGNINIWLTDLNNRGIANVPTFLKNKNGKVIFANRTGPNGYFLTNQIFPPGIYYIHFEQDTYQIPNVQLVLGRNTSKNPIKITAQMKQ
jgi:hypothetical protein